MKYLVARMIMSIGSGMFAAKGRVANKESIPGLALLVAFLLQALDIPIIYADIVTDIASGAIVLIIAAVQLLRRPTIPYGE